MRRPPPRSTLFPYTTLFRSRDRLPEHSFTVYRRSIVVGQSDRWRRQHNKCRATYFATRSEEHTSELQSQSNLVCRLLLEKKKPNSTTRCSTPHRYTPQVPSS